MNIEEKQIHLYMQSKNELGLATLCVEKEKEIERLNNIINEFDKYLVSVKKGCIYNVDVFLYKVVFNIYNKFKELEGDDNNAFIR